MCDGYESSCLKKIEIIPSTHNIFKKVMIDRYHLFSSLVRLRKHRSVFFVVYLLKRKLLIAELYKRNIKDRVSKSDFRKGVSHKLAISWPIGYYHNVSDHYYSIEWQTGIS